VAESIEELFSKLKIKLDAQQRRYQELVKANQELIESQLQTQLMGKLNPDELKAFSEEPYCIIPKRKDEWYVIAPKFVDFAIGYLERITKSYNIFLINKYVSYLYPIPEALKEKFKFKPQMPVTVYDGMVLTGEEFQDATYERYKKFLLRREGSDRIKIKRGKEFQLLAQMIDDGMLPFQPQPIAKEDLRNYPAGIELRDYQRIAWEKLKKVGAVGVYWPFGAGKTIIGLYAMAKIKGPHLVIVPTTTLKEQWLERVNRYLRGVLHEITIETYASYHKVRGKEWSLVIFDECHRLPANTFSRLATLKAKYRMGLSATPYREDGRTSYIFALTGFPVGLDWERLKRLKVFTPPDIQVYIFPSYDLKIKKLKELLMVPKKTLVFCDSINLGKRLSRETGYPFVYGDTKDRLNIIGRSETTIISRVGDEGVSVPDLKRVIEVDFLGGSRRQEGQRMGRLFHSQAKGEHIILMTEKEFQRFEKRLFAIYEKGFRIEIIR